MLEARELFSIRQLELRGPGDTNSSSIRSAGLTRTCLWIPPAFWQDSSWHDGNDQLRLAVATEPDSESTEQSPPVTVGAAAGLPAAASDSQSLARALRVPVGWPGPAARYSKFAANLIRQLEVQSRDRL